MPILTTIMRYLFISATCCVVIIFILFGKSIEVKDMPLQTTKELARMFWKKDSLNFKHFTIWCFKQRIFKATVEDLNKYIDEEETINDM